MTTQTPPTHRPTEPNANAYWLYVQGDRRAGRVHEEWHDRVLYGPFASPTEQADCGVEVRRAYAWRSRYSLFLPLTGTRAQVQAELARRFDVETIP